MTSAICAIDNSNPGAKLNILLNIYKLFRDRVMHLFEEGIRGSVFYMCGGSDCSYILGKSRSGIP